MRPLQAPSLYLSIHLSTLFLHLFRLSLARSLAVATQSAHPRSAWQAFRVCYNYCHRPRLTIISIPDLAARAYGGLARSLAGMKTSLQRQSQTPRAVKLDEEMRCNELAEFNLQMISYRRFSCHLIVAFNFTPSHWICTRRASLAG